MTILVAYASKHGATQGIAERIAATLNEAGVFAYVQPVSAVRGLDGYDAVIVGSAVYFGSWMKEAAQFVRLHPVELAARPVWLFSSGPIGEQPPVDPKEIAEFRDAFTPRGHRVFYGALDQRDLTFTERLMVSALKAPAGDFRDWSAIDAWTREIAAALTPAAAAPTR